MRTIKVSAPGKIHLLGEHSVVYGKPAIIAAVNKRCFVEIIPRKDTVIEIISKNLNISQKLDGKKIITKAQNAQEQWKQFNKTNNKSVLKSITTEILDYPTIAIGETMLFYKKPLPSGFTLIIDSEICSGMGSSAALAVSIAGAVSLFLGKTLNKAIINKIAFLSEQKIHGFPSGGDNATSCYGGLLWYRKEAQDFSIIQPLPFILSETLQKHFFIINTGTPVESTGEMVSMVKTLYQNHPVFCEKIFNNQERLVRDLLPVIENENENAIIQILKNGERNLEKLDVVSPQVKALIRKIEKTGGAAKICGAGGKTHATGILLVFHKNVESMQELLWESDEKVQCEQIFLGADGIREEVN